MRKRQSWRTHLLAEPSEAGEGLNGSSKGIKKCLLASKVLRKNKRGLYLNITDNTEQTINTILNKDISFVTTSSSSSSFEQLLTPWLPASLVSSSSPIRSSCQH